MKRFIRLTLLLIVTTTTLSCHRNKVYDKYRHTPVTGWEKSDTLIFKTSPAAQDGDYRADLGIRITELFPFLSLTMIVEQTIHPSNVTSSDTLTCPLIDKNGIERGKGISYIQYTFPINTIKLAQGNSVSFCVRHNMMRDILPGISDVGISMSYQHREIAEK